MPNYTHCPECEGCEDKFRNWERLKDIQASSQTSFSQEAGYLSKSLRKAAAVLFELGEVDLSERCDDLDTDLDKAADRLENEVGCSAFIGSSAHELCEVHDA